MTKKMNLHLKKMISKAIPSEQIDKSIMEKSNNIYCYPVNFGWSDIGSWDSYRKMSRLQIKIKKFFKLIQIVKLYLQITES